MQAGRRSAVTPGRGSAARENKRVPKDKLEVGGWSGNVEDICVPPDEVDT
jgi:hypothetical protein